MHQARTGEFRVTVPIDLGRVTTTNMRPVSSDRFPVAHSIELVALDQAERDRLMHKNISTDCRLEFFDLLDDDWDHMAATFRSERGHQHHRGAMDAAARAVLQALALGALASSTSLRPARIAVDRFDGSHWTRAAYIEVALPWQAHAGGTAYIPLVCLPSWGNLIDRWPKSDALDLALGYFAESVADWHDGRLQRSLLSAAIATEVLFSDSASELSHRMSLRGAHLVATGQPAIAVQARLKRLYAVRSGVVHSGKPVTAQSCRDWHMFLMAALPRAAAHGGDMPRLRKELDQANFLRSEGLRALDDPAAWWSFCDFAGFASAGGA